MKKHILITLVLSAFTFGLTSCGLGGITRTGTAVVGTGVDYVGTGVGYVGATGTRVVRTVGTGVGTWVGRVATDRDVVIYRKRGVVYHDGHAYRIHNGRYVLVR
ncbi:hypothetical protein [Legionella clemsonensis]|uniref:Lipoprotein n=1 Tax=Legionella clemsonensis TaxID=1867846 RepID=A0A222P0K5_9GAMM|nr:hypothetical protein [Legionella clemsonensis]ASQ45362.1 hypothetical protein clem_04020 [Legionella clemsonensis]